MSALLAKRSVCEQCGLRFDSGGANRYEKHLDWHVRKSLAASKTKETKSRAWYCSVEVCNYTYIIMIRKIWRVERMNLPLDKGEESFEHSKYTGFIYIDLMVMNMIKMLIIRNVRNDVPERRTGSIIGE